MSHVLLSALVPLLLCLLLVAGLMLLVRGWRGVPELSSPTCAACGYDLRGASLSGAAHTCPECGSSLKQPRAVHFGRSRRRPGMMIAGGAMILLPLVPAVVLPALVASRTVRAGPRIQTQSTAAIVQSLAQTADTPWPWNELQRRHVDGSLSNDEVAAAIDQLIAHITAQQPGFDGPLHWSGTFVERALQGGSVSQAQRDRLYDAYYGVNVPLAADEVQMRTRLRSGQDIRFDLNTATAWNLPGVRTLAYLKAIKIDDREVPVRSWAGEEQPDGLSSGGAFGLNGAFTMDAEPGDHVVTFELEMGLVDERDGDFGPHRPPGKPGRWPPTLRRWSQRAQVTVQVLPVDQSPIDLVKNDPELQEQVRNAVRIRHVMVTPSAEGQEMAKVDLWFDKKPPIALSFDVVLRADDKEINMGSFTASGSGSYGQSGFARRIDALPASLEYVDIVLWPDVAQVEQLLGTDRIWGSQLVYERVPVVRGESSK